MSDRTEVALGYVGRGWPVLPVEPRGKRPLGSLARRGLTEATLDPDVVREWWTRCPEANIGIRTGGAFDVLDVDGDEGFAALAVEMPADAPTIDGPTVTTGKGAHVYVAPTGLGNRARFIAGCDWRGNAGYVVAAGSVHPSGAVYGWKCGAEDPDFGIDAPILPAPAWLLELLQRRPVRGLHEPVPPGLHEPVVPAYGQAALMAECERVALAVVGSRNHQLNVAAFSLAQLVAAGILDPDEVADALLAASAKCGLSVTESRRTIASGFRAGLAQPRRVAS